MPSARPAPRLWALHAGGFMGPFGGAVVYTMLPELADRFGSSVQAASAAVTAYMIPFAALMLVSGTVGAHWGLAATVWRAFALYCVASLICIVAGNLELFLLGRALQGVANAFTTPLLIAMISEAVPHERLSSSFGVYASLQAAGQAFAPLIGGVAAAVDYRLAFVATAVVALVLMLAIPRAGKREAAPAVPGRWAALLNVRVFRAGGIAFCSQLVATAVITIGALVASDRFHLSPSMRGLAVAAFGVAGLLIAPATGRWADRVGLRSVGIVAMLMAATGIALIGVTPWLVLLIALIGVGGAAATGGRILTNSLAVTSTPRNPAGATSVMLAMQFLGSAAMPVLLPIYHRSAALSCLVAAAVALVGALLATLRPRAAPRPDAVPVR